MNSVESQLTATSCLSNCARVGRTEVESWQLQWNTSQKGPGKFENAKDLTYLVRSSVVVSVKVVASGIIVIVAVEYEVIVDC
jgi:hypothetical protein